MRGVIIAGADASVGTSGQSEPRPVVMRLTGHAVSAADHKGRTRKTDVTGCLVTGSTKADLSSERVYVRLIRMSCVDRDHPTKVIETNVRGFASGNGKTGIRGPVVLRQGDLISKAFFAGLAGGFGEAASQAFRPQALLTGDSLNRDSTSRRFQDSLQAGVSSGIGTAGAKIADYFIQRAEQYQPVISLSGGTIIDIVFLEGTWLDGRGDVQASEDANVSNIIGQTISQGIGRQN